MLQSLREAVPLVTQAIASSIGPSTDSTALRQLQSALKCLEAWIPNLPSKYASQTFPVPYRSPPTSNPVLQRCDTPSAFPVRASRSRITCFPTRRFRRLGSPVVPRFCGWGGHGHADITAP